MSLDDIRAKFPNAEVFEITELKHTETGTGPWKLYVYGEDHLHSGGVWFTVGEIKYPDEEISFVDAKEIAENSVSKGLEVRICDGMDHLVFHSLQGKILYGETFWNEAKPDPRATVVVDRLLGKGKAAAKT